MTAQLLSPLSPGDNLVIVNDNVENPDTRPVVYLDHNGVGAWFDVPGTTVAVWRNRYDDTPVPDVLVGRNPGWSEKREHEWRKWYASRPGRGAGGGRRLRRSP